jgi:hypothetical protein
MSTEVTRDVIFDLLHAVRGGIASADSRHLVESYLAKDPEFAARAAAQPIPSAAMELNALRRTRRAVHKAGWAMALGIFFTLLPLSIYGSSESGIRFIFADHPVFQIVSLLIGAFGWLAYFRHRTQFGG